MPALARKPALASASLDARTAMAALVMVEAAGELAARGKFPAVQRYYHAVGRSLETAQGATLAERLTNAEARVEAVAPGLFRAVPNRMQLAIRMAVETLFDPPRDAA